MDPPDPIKRPRIRTQDLFNWQRASKGNHRIFYLLGSGGNRGVARKNTLANIALANITLAIITLAIITLADVPPRLYGASFLSRIVNTQFDYSPVFNPSKTGIM